MIVSQIRRFDDMVLDLLELSRIDAGAADLHLETVEIAELCRRVAGHAGFSTVPVDVAPDAPSSAQVDRVRFERILGNLLVNAQHHAGGATRIAVEATDPGFVLVVVEDAGPGVSDEEKERIFERFARGSQSRPPCRHRSRPRARRRARRTPSEVRSGSRIAPTAEPGSSSACGRPPSGPPQTRRRR